MAETRRDLAAHGPETARDTAAANGGERSNGEVIGFPRLGLARNGHDHGATNGVAGPVPDAVGDVARLSTDELKRQIDALSLEQALIDFEVANARVLDLTGRLVAASKRVVDLQAQADALRAEIAQLHGELSASHARVGEITSSRAYRWGHRLSALRDALRS